MDVIRVPTSFLLLFPLCFKFRYWVNKHPPNTFCALDPGLRAEMDAELISGGGESGSSRSTMEVPLGSVYKADCDQPSKRGPTDKSHWAKTQTH